MWRDNGAVEVGSARGFLDEASLSRVAPFAVFMLFILIEEALGVAATRGLLELPDTFTYYLYPLKALTVAALLFHYLGSYRELRLADLLEVRTTGAVCLLGVATCALWVCLDWVFSVTGAPRGFNPALLPEGAVRLGMTAARIAGAVLVVPLMEELFWRSFLLRYLESPDFESVQLGRLSWPSFLITTVLFGLEHHLFVAGMVAGAIYNLVLYKTRSLAHCVLAHAVTNLALACYVLSTGRWDFW